MQQSAWSANASWEEVRRRAGGRRRYNAVRGLRALLRRREVARLLSVQGGLTYRGTQARLARQLGVSRATICRDLAYLMRQCYPCRCCGAMLTPPPQEED